MKKLLVLGLLSVSFIHFGAILPAPKKVAEKEIQVAYYNYHYPMPEIIIED